MNLKTAILTSIIAFKSCDAATAIKQKAAVGIDLGTTNSCVAVVDSTGENSIRIIENSFTDKTTPSVVRVSLTDDNNLRYEVGKDAILKNKDDTIGNRFFSSCKRLLGYSSFDDDMLFEKINKNVSYHIKNGSDGDKSFIYMPIKDENNKEIYKLRPVEVSAQVLGYLKTLIDKENLEIEQLYVTVPAYFAENQKEATKAACAIANLPINGTVAEPVAAAMAYKVLNASYQSEDDTNTNLVVVDLGGGTTDISVLASGRKGFAQVITYAGHNFLGGDNVNHLLVEHFTKELKEKQNYVPRKNVDRQRLEMFAEGFKIKLCNRQLSKRQLSSATSDNFIVPQTETQKEIVHNFSMTGEEFDRICKPFYEEFRKTLTGDDGIIKKMKGEGKSIEDIDLVLAVGGSTYIPKIREIIDEVFVGENSNASVDYTLNADICVAQGAAFYAAEKANFLSSEAQIVFIDAVALSLGIRVNEDVMANIIEKNSTLPAKGTKTFTTSRDNQKTVRVDIAQGSFTKFSSNKQIGTMDLVLTENMRMGEPQIEVTMSINTNNEITVEAYETITKKSNSVKISKTDATLSPETIKKMTEEYERNKVEDEKFRNTQESLSSMHSTIIQTKKTCEALCGEKKERTDELIAILETWYNSNKSDTTKEKVDERLKEFNKDLSIAMGEEQKTEKPREVGNEDL